MEPTEHEVQEAEARAAPEHAAPEAPEPKRKVALKVAEARFQSGLTAAGDNI